MGDGIGITNMDARDMDIERFSPNHYAAGNTGYPASTIAPLPPTVEMTGFSGSRHYHEQQAAARSSKGQLPKNELGFPPLDSLYH
ncbi:hypothetical protein C9I98_12650 [Photobacterium sanctipauli]|uniref:Uncharacterized protein n=2 Tax=Photobacterium sanctipauli TaxID=1342794 RepID=A0A2T3NSI4_9GAMM|nr:hypothetical protein C9I98_12650 [Photobacterium sanctipauli]